MTAPKYVGSNQDSFFAEARVLMERIKRIERAIAVLAKMAQKAVR